MRPYSNHGRVLDDGEDGSNDGVNTFSNINQVNVVGTGNSIGQRNGGGFYYRGLYYVPVLRSVYTNPQN